MLSAGLLAVVVAPTDEEGVVLAARVESVPSTIRTLRSYFRWQLPGDLLILVNHFE
jgi:hypothetical protein